MWNGTAPSLKAIPITRNTRPKLMINVSLEPRFASDANAAISIILRLPLHVKDQVQLKRHLNTLYWVQLHQAYCFMV